MGLTIALEELIHDLRVELNIPEHHNELFHDLQQFNEPYSDVVGKAYWNAAQVFYKLITTSYFSIRSLATAYKEGQKEMAHYFKMLDDKVFKANRHLQSQTPKITNPQILHLAKIYKKFIESMVAVPDPLQDIRQIVETYRGSNFATSYLNEYEELIKEQFQISHCILLERIGTFTAEQSVIDLPPEVPKIEPPLPAVVSIDIESIVKPLLNEKKNAEGLISSLAQRLMNIKYALSQEETLQRHSPELSAKNKSEISAWGVWGAVDYCWNWLSSGTTLENLTDDNNIAEMLLKEKRELESEIKKLKRQSQHAVNVFEQTIFAFNAQLDTIEKKLAHSDSIASLHKELCEIKTNFDTLKRTGEDVFSMQRLPSVREFKKKFKTVGDALTAAEAQQKKEQLKMQQEIAQRKKQLELEENNTQQRQKIYAKYFGQYGLVDQYFTNRAKIFGYRLYDAVQNAVSFFGVKSDVQQRRNYFNHLDDELTAYRKTGDLRTITALVKEIKVVLSSNAQFRARESGSSHSMRALLSKFKDDLEFERVKIQPNRSAEMDQKYFAPYRLYSRFT